MNDVIEVKRTIFECTEIVNKIREEIDSSEKKMKEIDIDLASYKWQGDAHDQCIFGQILIGQYTTRIRLLVKELDVCLQDLMKDVTGFEQVSRNVKNWEAW
jgi:hypothetical protein